jgi:hypothetical protein
MPVNTNDFIQLSAQSESEESSEKNLTPSEIDEILYTFTSSSFLQSKTLIKVLKKLQYIPVQDYPKIVESCYELEDNLGIIQENIFLLKYNS